MSTRMLRVLVCACGMLPAQLLAQALPAGVLLPPAGGRVNIAFGTAVAVAGEYAAIGANFDDGTLADAGAVHVYRRDGSTWLLQQRLLATPQGSNHHLGHYVEMHDDRIYATAKDYSGGASFSGAVFVFQLIGGNWTQVDRLEPLLPAGAGGYGSRIAVDDQFLVLAGRRPTGEWTAHVLEPLAGSWAETQVLQVGSGAFFTSHLSLHRRTLVLGSENATHNDAATGAVYVFDRVGAQFVQTVKLTASDAAANASFGSAASIWGDRLVVGSFRASVAGNLGQGAAYVFERSAGTWTEVIRLTAPDGVAGDQFGKDVRICGNRIIVGAPERDENGNDREGAIYVYDRVGGAWVFGEKWTLPAPGRANAKFGDHLGIDPRTLVVGAPSADRAYAFAGGCAVDEVHSSGFE